jgi:hypothetical protein
MTLSTFMTYFFNSIKVTNIPTICNRNECVINIRRVRLESFLLEGLFTASRIGSELISA